MDNEFVKTLINEYKDKYSNELNGYIYIDSKSCNNIPKGVHIKIIDLYGNLYSKGFLVNIIDIDKPSRIILLTKSYNKCNSIKLINYFVFYKKLKLTKRELFLNLLKKINK